MDVRIEQMSPRILVGNRVRMNYSGNKTFELWRGFMPNRNRIAGRKGEDLFSVSVFTGEDHFANLTAETMFDKWAAAEVTEPFVVPDGMESLTLTGGTYAVFTYRGRASEFQKVFGYILGEWMPVSGFQPDHREQFEILQPGYDPNNPESTEEIWIPVKPV
jgi:AraC family transcriptional regulator